MVVFNSKPFTNLEQFPSDVSDEEKRFITALLIEEHGVTLSKGKNSYAIRSNIYTKGGYGNVVLDVYKTKSGVKVNQFITLNGATMPSDSVKASQRLETKFGVNIDGGIRWTGNSGQPNTFEYAKFSSFADYVKYIKQRFNLPAGLTNKVELNNQLSRYSGKVVGYAGAVRNIMGNISVVAL